MQSKNNDKIRLFIGSPVCSKFKGSNFSINNLESYFNCKLKTVEDENLHLTWKFIGDASDEHIPEIKSILDEAKKFNYLPKIQLNKFEIWQKNRIPRQIVITGTDTDGQATLLFDLLNKNLSLIGIEADKRKFNPHITCARFNIKQKPANKLILPDWLKLEMQILYIQEIHLYKSTLASCGSKYEILHTLKI